MNEIKTDAQLAEPHFQHPQPQKSTPAADQIDTGKPDPTQQLQDLTNRIQALETTAHGRVVFNTGIIGLFETVTVAPTGVPISPYDQIKLANLSGTFYLYAYNTNSNTWKRVAIT